MADNISWVATIATIIAASMTAANLGSRITGYGFAVFLIGSLAWLATGFLTGQPALVWTNAVLTVLNIFGVWRWLGRQARVEEGARSASEASEDTPGEALFPISLLSHAPVRRGGDELGQCIDAMAACRSGKLSYVVVSEGGIAGVGESLRRVPWLAVHVEAEALETRLSAAQFRALEVIERDRWPAR
jgi:membrane protein implicated in regulation of membrane protease activity